MKKSFFALFLGLSMMLVSCNNGSGSETGSSKESLSENESTYENTESPSSDSNENPGSTNTHGELPGQDVRVMSMNLDANEATISKRARNLVSVLESYAPDSIGVQECRGTWNSLLPRLLSPEYERVGVAADGSKQSSSAFATYIYYNSEKYNLVDSGTFWLSFTPDIPSIYGSTVDCNRTCTWAILENKETGFKYVHMNSHLDWMDVNATDYQISLIRDQILRFEKMGLPVFATGDYNTDEGSDTYKLMLNSEKIADSKFVAEKSMDLGTYPSYGSYDVTKQKPIDFCFITKDMMTVKEYKVVDDKPDGEYISDHNGLFIHAFVHPLADSFDAAQRPDISSLKINVDETEANRIQISFNSVVNENPITEYTITVIDSSGNEVQSKTEFSGYMNKTVPVQISTSLSGLSPETEYKVYVTAKNLFGLESEQISATLTTGKALEPEDVGKADLFELFVNEDGQFADISENRFEITVLGSPRTVKNGGEYAVCFERDGCLKIPGIKDHYDELGDGFSAEVYVKFNSVSGDLQNIFGNMHSGGFGFEAENGKITAYLHCGGAYKTIEYAVETGNYYHIVSTYDTESFKLYIDGELVGSVETSGDMGYPTDAGARWLCVGADSDASGMGEYFADAEISIARLYSDDLSSGQVLYLFNATQTQNS